jgi:hypothetical protein
MLSLLSLVPAASCRQGVDEGGQLRVIECFWRTPSVANASFIIATLIAFGTGFLTNSTATFLVVHEKGAEG